MVPATRRQPRSGNCASQRTLLLDWTNAPNRHVECGIVSTSVHSGIAVGGRLIRRGIVRNIVRAIISGSGGGNVAFQLRQLSFMFGFPRRVYSLAPDLRANNLHQQTLPHDGHRSVQQNNGTFD
jgi:hypothetical protein